MSRQDITPCVWGYLCYGNTLRRSAIIAYNLMKFLTLFSLASLAESKLIWMCTSWCIFASKVPLISFSSPMLCFFSCSLFKYLILAVVQQVIMWLSGLQQTLEMPLDCWLQQGPILAGLYTLFIRFQEHHQCCILLCSPSFSNMPFRITGYYLIIARVHNTDIW